MEVSAPVAGEAGVCSKMNGWSGGGNACWCLRIRRATRWRSTLSTDARRTSRPGSAHAGFTGWGGSKTLEARVRTVEPAAFTCVAPGVEEQRVNVVADFVDPPGPPGDAYRGDGHVVLGVWPTQISCQRRWYARTRRRLGSVRRRTAKAPGARYAPLKRNAAEVEVLRRHWWRVRGQDIRPPRLKATAWR